MLLKENPKYSEQNLSHCHSVHHKYHVDCPGIEPGPRSREASEKTQEISVEFQNGYPE
jgi:hypothetical protein